MNAESDPAFEWVAVADNVPPQDTVVMTKIDDGRGVRNQTPLKRHGNLWFLPDMSICVYYEPTHWAPLPGGSDAPDSPRYACEACDGKSWYASSAVVRPFEEQTPLEKTIRAIMWHPEDAVRRCEENLAKHARRKEYRAAADCQDRIRKAKAEIGMWQNILTLYEAERCTHDLWEDMIRACESGMSWMDQLVHADIGSAMRGILSVDMACSAAAIGRAKKVLAALTPKTPRTETAAQTRPSLH